MPTPEINISALPDRAPLAYRVYKWLVIIRFLATSTALIGLIVTALPYLGAPDYGSRAADNGFWCADFNTGT